MSDDLQFRLPSKVDTYLAALNRLYEQKGEAILREVIVNGAVAIHEGWDYDNWNGGTYGHAITLTVPEDIYVKIIEEMDDVQRRLAADLNKLDNSPNEHVSEVFIEMEPVDGDRWREDSGILRPRMAASSISPGALERIWGPEHVRVFLSHKASVKVETSRLKQSLARCGTAAFVAHEDIEPTEEWQREIERALFSMDALVALLTADFPDSNWTDQEVGVAIGRNVPLIAVRLERDPYGLMGKAQALSGCSWSDTDSMAVKVFRLLHKRLPDKSRLFECAVSAYAASETFAESEWKVASMLSLFETLTSTQVQRVLDAHGRNRQNWDSFKGTKLLAPLLSKWTGKNWVVRNNGLKLIEQKVEDEIPF